jgi:Sulfatase/HEAT repeats
MDRAPPATGSTAPVPPSRTGGEPSTPRSRLLAALDVVVPWLVATAIAGVLLFASDRLRALAESGKRSFLRGWPMITLAAGHVTLAVLALALGALGWALGRRFATRDGMRGVMGRIVIPAACWLTVLAWPLLLAGRGLTSGGWISEQWFAPAVRLAPLGLGALAAPIVAWVAFGRASSSRRRIRVLTAALALGVVFLQLADHVVAPGLYPELHMMLEACSAMAAVLTVHRCLPLPVRWLPELRRWLVRAAVAFVVAALPLWFAMPGTTRAALILRSPVAREWIRHAMPERAPSLLRDELLQMDVGAGELAAAGEVEAPRGLIDAHDYNIVLVVVDTLRADALLPSRPEQGTEFAHPGDTPFLDEWLAGTVRFSNSHAAATMTHKSMPNLFRSIEVADDPILTGVPLGRRMEELGRVPEAVVIDYFYAAKYPSAGALLDGFDDVAVFDKRISDTAVPKALETLERLRARKFFLWLHMYNMHDPGFAGKLLTGGDGSRIERYRESLRWLDGELRKLIEGMAALGLAENTIVVLVSDHGEGLGSHTQMLHGPNIFEEDLHVPLAFYIPGVEPRVIDTPVGNIDVVPTLVDLLGAPVGPADRGRSLVPLIADPEAPWRPGTYYFTNASGNSYGVLRDGQKLVYEKKADVIYRFDLANDPGEDEDVFDPSGELDRELLRELMTYNPGLVADELDEPEVVELLQQRLDAIDPEAPGEALPLLVKLVALHPDPPLVRRTAAIFKQSNDVELKLLLLRHLAGPAPRTYGPLITKWLQTMADRPEELAIVAALAQQVQGAFDGKFVVKRMNAFAEKGAPESWEPWLRMVRPWKKSVESFGGSLGTMLERSIAAPRDVPPSILELVLDDVSTLSVRGHDAAPLLVSVRALARSEDARIRAAAVRALGGLADRSSTELLKARLADQLEDPRVRRNAAIALRLAGGESSVSPLVAVAEEPLLTIIVLRQLAALGSRKGLPFLRKIAKTHYNSWFRREARKAIDDIEGRKSKERASAGGDDAPSQGDDSEPPAAAEPEN